MNALKNIGLIFVISLLILATGGFSVYHHICRCDGEMSASVFVEAECQHDQQASDCSHSGMTAACCEKKEAPVKKHTCHHDNCCQNSVQFFKISDSFQSGLEKISLKPAIVVSAVLFLDVIEDVLSPGLIIPRSDLPLPETGKHILIALHQLKLDTHLV